MMMMMMMMMIDIIANPLDTYPLCLKPTTKMLFVKQMLICQPIHLFIDDVSVYTHTTYIVSSPVNNVPCV